MKINQPAVLHETVEGKVVMIHYASGNYYFTELTGAEIWGLLERGPIARSSILEHLMERYGSRETSDLIRGSVTSFLEQLVDEKLVVQEERQDDDNVVNADLVNAGDNTFHAPVLEKFDDMNQLILQDPVHEVGPQGWEKAVLAEDES